MHHPVFSPPGQAQRCRPAEYRHIIARFVAVVVVVLIALDARAFRFSFRPPRAAPARVRHTPVAPNWLPYAISKSLRNAPKTNEFLQMQSELFRLRLSEQKSLSSEQPRLNQTQDSRLTAQSLEWILNEAKTSPVQMTDAVAVVKPDAVKAPSLDGPYFDVAVWGIVLAGIGIIAFRKITSRGRR